MLPPATGAVYQYVASLGDPGDGIWWYSVATADGTALSPFLSQASTCAACDFHIYPIGYSHTELTGSGVSETWKGLTVTGTSTCTEGPGTDEPGTVISCNVTKCMPAGKYVVTMCGSTASSTGPCQPRSPFAACTCISVPFDYPAAAEVVGTLPP